MHKRKREATSGGVAPAAVLDNACRQEVRSAETGKKKNLTIY